MGGSNHHSTYYSTFNQCHSECPLHRGCPLVGGSIIYMPHGSIKALDMRDSKFSLCSLF